MKPRTLLVLALVVGALGAFVAFYERDLPGSDERARLEKKVFRLEADDVTGLEIEWNGKSVKLERPAKAAAPEDGGVAPAREWKLLAPTLGRADRQLADQVARALAELDVDRTLEGAGRKDVGLDPPRGKVTWTAPEGQGTLEIGGDIPATSKLVVAATERPDLLVVGRAVVTAIDRAPGDWRAKEVVSAQRDAIERVRIVPAGGEEVVLARKGDEFTVERPFADAAEPDRWEPLLSDITSLRAERFLDAPVAPEAEAGLAAEAGRFEIAVRGESEPLVIELGGEVSAGGPRYVRAGGQAIEARTHLDEAVARAPEEWRSRHWASFDSWKVERIRVQEDGEAGEPLEVARESGDWKRGGDTIPYSTVGDLLYALNSSRADRVLSGAAAAAVPATSPELTVVLSDGEGAEQTLTLNGEVEGGVAARVSGRDVVLVLPAEKVGELHAKIAAVREAKTEGATEPEAGGAPSETGSEAAPPAPEAGAEEESGGGADGG